ncbi:DNA recombination protein RmuC [Mycoplasma struthionis]|uniref:DNA recombination protein RmuC n=1 Tax=Mycoplasma struthionis TaxID=538220 RepID=A0A3G8LGB5_9MOLU|nr:DNA recombination protein RmuC [Mycoplasma struthionis]AZG68713.1 DNA recombination protein RmuC [Mycoplasma struthionis]
MTTIFAVLLALIALLLVSLIVFVTFSFIYFKNKSNNLNETLTKKLLEVQELKHADLLREIEAKILKIENLIDKQYTHLDNKLNNEWKDKISENLKINLKENNEIISNNFSNIVNQIKTQTFSIEKLKEKIIKTINEEFEKITQKNTETLLRIKNEIDEHLKTELIKKLENDLNKISSDIQQVYDKASKIDNVQSDMTLMNKIFIENKSRGNWGERQLKGILDSYFRDTGIIWKEQIDLKSSEMIENLSDLSEEEKEKRKIVDFAIKIEADKELESDIWLPIDSKFVLGSLIGSLDKIDDEKVYSEEIKKIVDAVVKQAKDIQKKYIIPGLTTDYAILYIPSQKLFNEVIKDERFENGKLDKVWITSPLSIMPFLELIRSNAAIIKITKNVNIIKNLFINVFENYQIINDKFTSAGKQMDKARDSVRIAQNKLNSTIKVLNDKAKRIGLNKKIVIQKSEEELSDLADIEEVTPDSIEENE